MTKEENSRTVVAPSKEKIAKATIAALVVAAIVLVTTILPAEYGIDPLGAGTALGLLNLSTGEVATVGTPVPVISGTVTPQPKPYKVDAEDFTLFPGDGFEFKYYMQRGAVMVYSWKASGKLLFEFHGEPDQKPTEDYYESYELDDKVGKEESYGSFTAPSTGVHGWFWENKGDKEVMLRLTTAGFYSVAKQYSGFGVEDIPLEDVK